MIKVFDPKLSSFFHLFRYFPPLVNSFFWFSISKTTSKTFPKCYGSKLRTVSQFARVAPYFKKLLHNPLNSKYHNATSIANKIKIQKFNPISLIKVNYCAEKLSQEKLLIFVSICIFYPFDAMRIFWFLFFFSWSNNVSNVDEVLKLKII